MIGPRGAGRSAGRQGLSVRDLLIPIASVTAALGFVLAPHTHAATAGLSPVQASAASGYCLDNTGDSSSNGNHIQIWKCNGDAAQNWKFVPDSNGIAGDYMLQNSNGKCLDDPDDSKADGTKVQLWSCLGNPNQEWRQAAVGSFVEYVNSNGLCLDDTGDSHTDGTRVQIFACRGDTAQQWDGPTSEATLTDFDTADVAGGYVLQANEYNSTAAFTVTSSGNPDLAVTTSQIDASPNVGAYPSIFMGNHFGDISPTDPFPINTGNLADGSATVNTVYQTIQKTSSSDQWDCSYDIWYNSSTSGDQNNGVGSDLEMMVWLNHQGSVQPAGNEVATNVAIGGNTYNVWNGTTSTGAIVTYELVTGATGLNLSLGPLVADSISRGYMATSWDLYDVEAGFELFSGGAGLQATSFSVSASS
jgi:hypothetical protein